MIDRGCTFKIKLNDEKMMDVGFEALQVAGTKKGAVLYDREQELTADEMARARENIGAVAADEVAQSDISETDKASAAYIKHNPFEIENAGTYTATTASYNGSSSIDGEQVFKIYKKFGLFGDEYDPYLRLVMKITGDGGNVEQKEVSNIVPTVDAVKAKFEENGLTWLDSDGQTIYFTAPQNYAVDLCEQKAVLRKNSLPTPSDTAWRDTGAFYLQNSKFLSNYNSSNYNRCVYSYHNGIGGYTILSRKGIMTYGAFNVADLTVLEKYDTVWFTETGTAGTQLGFDDADYPVMVYAYDYWYGSAAKNVRIYIESASGKKFKALKSENSGVELKEVVKVGGGGASILHLMLGEKRTSSNAYDVDKSADEIIDAALNGTVIMYTKDMTRYYPYALRYAQWRSERYMTLEFVGVKDSSQIIQVSVDKTQGTAYATRSSSSPKACSVKALKLPDGTIDININADNYGVLWGVYGAWRNVNSGANAVESANIVLVIEDVVNYYNSQVLMLDSVRNGDGNEMIWRFCGNETCYELTTKVNSNTGKVTATLADATASLQKDWMQNDASRADYIKNRPGGYYVSNEVFVYDGDLSDEPADVVASISGGRVYRVIIDGKLEEYTGVANADVGITYIVGGATFDEINTGTASDYWIIVSDGVGTSIIGAGTFVGKHITVTAVVERLIKIPREFIEEDVSTYDLYATPEMSYLSDVLIPKGVMLLRIHCLDITEVDVPFAEVAKYEIINHGDELLKCSCNGSLIMIVPPRYTLPCSIGRGTLRAMTFSDANYGIYRADVTTLDGIDGAAVAIRRNATTVEVSHHERPLGIALGAWQYLNGQKYCLIRKSGGVTVRLEDYEGTSGFELITADDVGHYIKISAGTNGSVPGVVKYVEADEMKSRIAYVYAVDETAHTADIELM